jgi:hypothetical protein
MLMLRLMVSVSADQVAKDEVASDSMMLPRVTY